MIMVVAGTRPEIIKLAPVYRELHRRKMDPVWVYTGQSPDLALDTYKAFDMAPEVEQKINRVSGSLMELQAHLSENARASISSLDPAMVVVQGDTLSAAVFAQQGFLAGKPTAHVEAGLRSWDITSPYPEEACRVWIDSVADLKFAPTPLAAGTLSGKVYVTGNTVVDALNMVKSKSEPRRGRYAVVTMHRRENAHAVKEVCNAIREIAAQRLFDYIVWPVHPNPAVRDVVPELMKDVKNVEIVSPLRYDDMVNLVRGAKMLLTDSGGLQEEALGLGVPCLVMRKETERPEGVHAGGAKIVGTSKKKITGWAHWIMSNPEDWEAMATAPNPYGDGKASERIVVAIKAHLDGREAPAARTNWTPPKVSA